MGIEKRNHAQVHSEGARGEASNSESDERRFSLFALCGPEGGHLNFLILLVGSLLLPSFSSSSLPSFLPYILSSLLPSFPHSFLSIPPSVLSFFLSSFALAPAQGNILLFLLFPLLSCRCSSSCTSAGGRAMMRATARRGSWTSTRRRRRSRTGSTSPTTVAMSSGTLAPPTGCTRSSHSAKCQLTSSRSCEISVTSTKPLHQRRATLRSPDSCRGINGQETRIWGDGNNTPPPIGGPDR